MPTDLETYLPLQLLLVTVASFLIGLEMEGRKVGGKQFSPGGVRTFPLICLAGFLLALLNKSFPYAFVIGLAVLGVWLAMLYRAKCASQNYGITTEMYALVTYVIGGLAVAQLWWLVATLTVLMVMVQELKDPLERLATRLPADELATVAKFVLLTAVILPLIPGREYTRFALKPQKIWLIVIAVTAVSYASYLLQRILDRRPGGARHGVLLTGLLGGAWSSTATTVVLARRSRAGDLSVSDAGLAGSILASSGVMNLRLTVLLALFGVDLLRQVAWPLGVAAAVGVVGGTLISLVAARRTSTSHGGYVAQPPSAVIPNGGQFPSPSAAHRPAGGREARPYGSGPPGPAPAAYFGEPGPAAGAAEPRPAGEHRSPLELPTALAFGAMITVMLVLTHQAGELLGDRGLLALAGLSGLGVVDPFVLSLTQHGQAVSTAAESGGVLFGPAAALAVVVAAAANHVAKGVYAAFLARRRAGVYSLLLLLGLAAVTLATWWAF